MEYHELSANAPSGTMADWELGDLAHKLSDLEVALLLSLIAREHPLIETTEACIGDVAQELALVCIYRVLLNMWHGVLGTSAD